MKRAGFTLIELLLVLAILGTLAALIFALMGPARESARQRVCISNLHQIGRAFAMYIADYDGIEPHQGSRLTHAQLGLPDDNDKLQPYLRNKEVVYCPSYHGEEPKTKGVHTTYMWPGTVKGEIVPELDIPGEVARLGKNYPLVACDQHNARLDFSRQPRWALMRVIVLRISQQVDMRNISVRDQEIYHW
jgi:prepilin-type N-terminal cleavage/methylation domain-containing protein